MKDWSLVAWHCYTTSPCLLSCRRLDPTERPLQMVYDYLASMGYADPVRVQQEAANSDLSCLIRFYSGEYWATWAVIPKLHYLLLLGWIWQESRFSSEKLTQRPENRLQQVQIDKVKAFVVCSSLRIKSLILVLDTNNTAVMASGQVSDCLSLWGFFPKWAAFHLPYHVSPCWHDWGLEVTLCQCDILMQQQSNRIGGAGDAHVYIHVLMHLT